MSRNKRKHHVISEPLAPEQRLKPKSNAPDCQMCKQLREDAGRENDTVVYCTRGVVRYVKCRVCLHTFKFVPRTAG